MLKEEINGISPSERPTENKGNEVHEADESHTVSANKEWTALPSNQRSKLPSTRRNPRQLPFVTPNKFATPPNLNNENQFPECVPQTKRPYPVNNCHKDRRPPLLSVSKTKHVNQQIVIVGDSHARKSATELKHCLDPTFAISTFVKPGAGMNDVIDSVREDIKKLKQCDVTVICGGLKRHWEIQLQGSNETSVQFCKEQSKGKYCCDDRTSQV